jgi:hypothetical protein
MLNANQPLTFGRNGAMTGNGGRLVQVTSNGKVDRAESVGVDRKADGFLASIQDERITQALRSQAASPLAGRWQTIPSDTPGHLSWDCGDQRVWKYGGTQQLDVDCQHHKLSLSTLGDRGEHTIKASYDPSSGRVNPKTITEEFAPYNTAYVAAMRDMY